MLQKVRNFLQQFKKICFEFLFVLHHNAITNKHLIVFVQFLELISIVYFYFNPIFQSLHKFSIFQLFFQSIWPKLFFLIPSDSFLISLILLSIFPSIIFCIVLMKLIFGYQYIILVAIQIWLLFYPVMFVKLTIESINCVIGFPEYRIIGVLVCVVHTLGSVIVLHFYDKKYKMVDVIPMVLLYCKVNSYAVLAFVIVRLIVNYFISPPTLIKPLRMHFELALLIILIGSHFAGDYLTNYISFGVILLFFTLSQIFFIVRNYNQKQSIFYHLQNLTEQQCDSKLKYYQFVQNHRIDCQNVNCMCRELGSYTKEQQIKQNGYKFVRMLYEFRQDVDSRIEVGLVSAEYYEYSLSGLLMLFELKPKTLYQEYKLYFVKTKYEQEFRKLDKNYSFGQNYYNAYEQVRSFEQKIEQLTRIIKQFWQTILYFDGSKKFISMIIQISEKITQIKQKYEIYIQKYEDFNNHFRYLYKTFQIAVLNLLDTDKSENSYSFGSTRKEVNIKVPERQLFFISNSEAKVVNCNREFCNLVEMNKSSIINHSYEAFIPEFCSEQHNRWVQQWYENYNRDEQQNSTIKPFFLKDNYIKCVKIANRILPRFDKGIQVISLIKVVTKLQNNMIHKRITSQIGQQLSSLNEGDSQTFFSFLIERNTMKILYLDDSFFYTTLIDETEEIKDKILSIRINQLFPKIVISGRIQNNSTNENFKQAMLNYSALQQFLGSKDKKSNMFAFTQTMKGGSGTLNTKQKDQDSGDDQPYVFSKKSKRRLPTIAGASLSGNTVVKENSQQVFLYEIVEQKNIGLQTEYCIINFQLKKSVASEVQSTLVKEKLKVKSKIVLNQQKQAGNKKARSSNMTQQQQGQKQIMDIIEKGKQKQLENNLNINLAFREPFIRSSKPYKQDNKEEEQINQKKAKVQQSNQFTKSSKSYCLGWPIVLPLFLVHIFYLQVHDSYSTVLLYLKNAFDFYDKYELESLRQLNVQFQNVTYTSQLKSLWISGFGFYHSSILSFQNPNDLFFQKKLIDNIIPQNLFGVYQQIQVSYRAQISGGYLYYYLIISILIVFLVYAAVDFAFNILYCFKISSRVTEIVQIFLNISEKDIRKLIYSIQKYQDQVLEITDFQQIEVMRRRQMEDYGLEQYENAGLTELSGIGFLKEEKYSFINDHVKNIDSLQTSPNKDNNDEAFKTHNKSSQVIAQSAIIIPKNNHKRNSSKMQLHRRRSSLAQKIEISKLKENMTFLKESGQFSSKQGSQHSFFQTPQKPLLGHAKKSSFIPNAFSFNQSNVMNGIQEKRDPDLKDQILQTVQNEQQQQKAQQQQQKLQKIMKFRQKHRGNINDIKQNPRPYIFLLVVILITVVILIIGLIIIPRYINNLEKFSSVYFDLRKLKIIMLNEMIKKKSSIQLLPNIKSSVYSLNFYTQVQSQLGQLPKFRYFWNKVYEDDVCAMVQDTILKGLCLSLDKSMTAYGQKVMFQFLEDELRRETSDLLFTDSLTSPSKFMNVSKLQMNLVALGEVRMEDEIHFYKNNAKSYELLIAIIGTVILFVCIFMSHKGLSNIRSKIHDGQNLLLIVPETIKTNVIKNMSLNKLNEAMNNQLKSKEKKKKKRRNSKKNSPNNRSPEPSGSPSSTGSELIANKSNLLNSEDDQALKSNLKAPEQRNSFLNKKQSK